MILKKLAAIIAICLSLTGLTGCTQNYNRYIREFYSAFDTITVITGYTESLQEFNEYYDIISGEMHRLHKLFDIYNDYTGVNNIKTINDNAGIKPVEVDVDIIELLELAKIAYTDSGGTVNVALGSVLRVWSRFREAGTLDPKNAVLPDMSELEAAAGHTDIDDVIIDRQNSTVFLRDPNMSLDVGALAKGYAVQKAMDKAKEAGLISGIINSGGEVRVTGVPMDKRPHWNIGVQGVSEIFDTLAISEDISFASSGNYERFFVVDGVHYGHIIDYNTMYPADRYASSSVLHPDCGVAEMLSTSIFILPYEQGLDMVQKYGADAVWIYHDGTARATDGYKELSQQVFG